MPDIEPPEPSVETPASEGPSRRISAVWLVPLLALLLALGVAWNAYSKRGPLIEIVFQNAAGVTPGQTTIRFRDVVVGTVESVRLSDDLRSVIVSARMEKDVARFMDADAQFWIVRPDVSARGVTGIETVISGVYISAWWDDVVKDPTQSFVGLPNAPLTPADQPGMRVQLRADTGGSISVGAPVLLKSIPVGRVESVDLTDQGDVAIGIFINAPYHTRVTEGTRFWNASGFSVEIGAGGAQLNVDSLISLLQGGISFDTVGSNVRPVTASHTFNLYPTESAARQNFFDDEPGSRLIVDAMFEGSVGGLQPGAPVQFRGLQIGEVNSIHAAIIDPDGQPKATLRATLSIAPSRIGIAENTPDPSEAALDALAIQVSHGLRAQLTPSGLLAQSLQVELVEAPDAQPAELQRDAQPNPVIPSLPSDPTSIAASAQGVLTRIGNLPLEEVVQNAATLLGNINALVTDERVRSAPENFGALMADIRDMIETSGIKQAPADLSATLASIRGLVDQAVQAKLVDQVNAVVAEAQVAVRNVGTAAAGAPALMDEIKGLSGDLRALPLSDLVTASTSLVGNVDTFVNSQELRGVPAELTASLEDLRGLLNALKDGGAVDNLNATLLSVRKVSDQVAAADLATSLQTVIAEAKDAASNVSTASQDLPALLDSLTQLSNRVNAMPLDELVGSANMVLQTADRLLASDGMAEVPANLSAALDQLRQILAELSAGGAAQSLNATLASANRAADAITQAADDLPALVANLNRLADQADAALSSVGPGSDINRNTILLLQEVRDTARSVNSLVLSLERKPNSILFGR